MSRVVALLACVLIFACSEKEKEKPPQEASDNAPIEEFHIGVPAGDYKAYSCSAGQFKKLKIAIKKSLQKSIFPTDFYMGGSTPSYNLEMDAPRFPNALLCSAEYSLKTVADSSGKNVLSTKKSGFSSNKISMESSGYNQISLPLVANTDRKKLSQATLDITVKYPLEFSVFKVKTGSSESLKKNGQEIQIKNFKDKQLTVQTKGVALLKAFAFSKGKRVSQESSFWSTSMGSYQWTYKSPPDTIVLVCTSKVEEVKTSLTVSLNGGSKLKLPRTPTAKVPTRYQSSSRQNYQLATAADLESWKVEWAKPTGLIASFGLEIPLKKSPLHGTASWETHLYAKNPVKYDGYSSMGNSIAYPFNKELDEQILGAYGVVKVSMTSDMQTLTFEKKSDGAKVVEKMKDGREVSVTFDKNQIKYDNGLMMKIISKKIVDKSGGELKEYFGISDGKAYWGIPQKVSLQLSLKKVERNVDFKLLREEAEADKFDSFVKKIEDKRLIVKALMSLHKNCETRLRSYADDIAAFHYLAEKEKLVPLEIANSDPKGAERFSYKVKPWRGYNFTVLKGMLNKGKKEDLKRRKKSVEFEFDEKKITTNLAWQRPVIAAIPQDKSQPTFILYWGQVYENTLPEALEYSPSQLYNSKWQQLKIVE